MIEDIQNILRVVTFIAVGGVVAVVFFFIFAQVITGSKSVHRQLERLIELSEQILRRLERLNTPADKEHQTKADSESHDKGL